MNTRVIAAAAASAALLGAVMLRAEVPQTRVLGATEWESCEEMHDDYVRRFEASPGFGLSRMYRPPMLDRNGVLNTGRVEYNMASLDLIGAFTLDKPVVYVTTAHGSSVKAETFKSRELTPFEKASLAAFKSGRSLAIETSPDSQAMACVGALRAKDTCLECHRNNKAGDLLGAFSYQLTARK